MIAACRFCQTTYEERSVIANLSQCWFVTHHKSSIVTVEQITNTCLTGGVLTLNSFRSDYRYGDTSATRASSLSVSLQQLGAFVACFLAWPLTDKFGRKKSVDVILFSVYSWCYYPDYQHALAHCILHCPCHCRAWPWRCYSCGAHVQQRDDAQGDERPGRLLFPMVLYLRTRRAGIPHIPKVLC